MLSYIIYGDTMYSVSKLPCNERLRLGDLSFPQKSCKILDVLFMSC